MVKIKETINIIGAGPAGLVAAIVLRKHGFPVKVFEMSSDVGHHLNGDFQGLKIFGDEYRKYMEKTPMFVPKRKGLSILKQG